MKDSWATENHLVVDDLKNVASDKVIPWEKLDNKSVLVTGATGLIGSLVVKALLYRADVSNKNITVGAFIRNEGKADKVLGNLKKDHANLVYEIGDLSEGLNLSRKYDYIVHAASATGSKDFIEKPVETILTTIERNRMGIYRMAGSIYFGCRKLIFSVSFIFVYLMWCITVDVFSFRHTLLFGRIMTLKMKFLLLPFNGTGRLRSVLDCLCHSIQA